LVERFKKIVEKLSINERIENPHYDGEYSVFVAKIKKPKGNGIQVRIELKAPDKFKPTCVITRYTDYLELKKFVEWLSEREEILHELTKMNKEKSATADYKEAW